MLQALQAADDEDAGKLKIIYPIIIGKPCNEGDPRYPCTGNFFTDGSADSINDLAAVPSPPTMTAVSNFLQKHRVAVDDEILATPVMTTVRDLMSLQGAQLWNHPTLFPEEVPEDLWDKVCKEPPVPPLNLQQLQMIKAELRALVPGIHEVIDRAHIKSAASSELRKAAEGRRRELLCKIVGRLSSERLMTAWCTWRDSVGESQQLFEASLGKLNGRRAALGFPINNSNFSGEQLPIFFFSAALTISDFQGCIEQMKAGLEM